MPDPVLPVIVAFCSQKGGVGKSTMARALAAAAARDTGVKVRIVDFDELQETSRGWAERRRELGVTPVIDVTVAHSTQSLRALGADVDVLIVDAPGRASRETLSIARQAHLVVQPTAGSSDDLKPGIALFDELVEEGVRRDRLVWALSRVDSEAEERDLREFLGEAGWAVLDGCLFNRSASKRAMDAGRAVTETPFKSLNDKATELVDSLNGALKRAVLAIYHEASARTPREQGRAA
jgi:chromosome partitioning protein